MIRAIPIYTPQRADPFLAVALGFAGALGALFGACAGPSPSPAVAGPWTAVAAAPIELLEVGVAAHHGKIWVAGGLRLDGASDRVLVLDPLTVTWTEGPRLPEAVHHAALVSTENALVLIGGYLGDSLGTATAAVRRLDDGTNAWTDEPPLPDTRAAGAAAFDGARIVYAGGVKPGGIANEVFARRAGAAAAGSRGVGGPGSLGGTAVAWQRIGRLPVAREHLAAASDGAGRTFFLGGRVGGLDRNLATVDLVEGESARTLGDLPTKRGGVAAFWWPSLGACLVGGESPGGANAQVECMAADGKLTRLPDLPTARHGVGAAVIDGTAYVVLGGRQPGLFVSDVTESLRLP
jgi:hypothetical protein